MVQCCAFECSNDGIHRFPANKRLRKKWENAVSWKYFKSTTASRLCRSHFKAEDYKQIGYYSGGLQRNVIKGDAVPSVFSWKKEDTNKNSHMTQEVPSKASVQRKLFIESNKVESAATIEDISSFSDLNTFGGSEEEVQCVGEFVCDLGCREEIIGVLEEAEDLQYSCTLNEDSDMEQPTSVEQQKKCPIYSAEYFSNDSEGIQFYTGLESFEKFLFVFHTLSPEVEKLRYIWGPVDIKPEDALLLTLTKLKRNITGFELSRFFAIPEKSVSNVIFTWIHFMYQLWSEIDIWPTREIVDYYMPAGFKRDYPTTRVIVDSTEIPIEKPKQPAAQQASFSTYKNRNTAKLEVGVIPDGLIGHCSAAYGGATSDRQIVERSGLLQKCEKGDSIMADIGFNVQDLFAPKGVTINIPTFLKGKSQLPAATVLKDRKLSSKRVHVERLIGLIKTYDILTSPLNHCYVPLASKIFFLCVMLCNFRESIISDLA